MARPSAPGLAVFAVAVLAAGVALPGCTGGRRPTSGGLTPSGVPGAGGTAPGQISDLAQRVTPSVVTILTPTGSGSGVVYRPEGVILTDAHIVGRAPGVRVVLADGSQVSGQVTGTDPVSDVALVRVRGGKLPAAVFQPALPRPGEPVLAVGGRRGPPGDRSHSLTRGLVTAVGVQLPGSGDPYPAVGLIQTNAAVAASDAGGALVNARGEVVGLTEATASRGTRATSGFAVPAGTAIDAANQMLATGKVVHPTLGMTVAPLAPSAARPRPEAVGSGVAVREVAAGGPAARAGIEPGDVIGGVNGTRISTVDDFQNAVRRTRPGERIPVAIIDGVRARTVEVTVASLPVG